MSSRRLKNGEIWKTKNSTIGKMMDENYHIQIYVDENDYVHNEEGPAYESFYVKFWFIHGILHREDGPAVVNKANKYEWRIDGEHLTERQFKNFICKKRINKLKK